jgi:hypothetical protein
MSCHFNQIHLMPIATIDGKKMCITTTAFANEYSKAIIEEFQGKEMLYYGLDAAWHRRDAANSSPLFQFSFPKEDTVHRISILSQKGLVWCWLSLCFERHRKIY